MEGKIEKLEAYLRDYYLDMDDNIYLFFKWILENEMYIVLFGPLTLMFKNQFKEFESLTEEIINEIPKIK